VFSSYQRKKERKKGENLENGRNSLVRVFFSMEERKERKKKERKKEKLETWK
jgi:hypothetical protein